MIYPATFADDHIILTTGKTTEEAKMKLQTTTHHTVEWSKKWKRTSQTRKRTQLMSSETDKMSYRRMRLNMPDALAVGGIPS